MLLDYDNSIKNQSTNSIGKADALSKLMNAHQNLPENSVVAAVSAEPKIVSVLTATVRTMPITLKIIKKATVSDLLLQKVIPYHYTKWLQTCPDKDLQPFNHQKPSIMDDCIILGECVIVPLPLQNRVPKQFDFGHQVISCRKALARTYVYWPNMNKQLNGLVQNYTKCQLAAKSQRKSELFSWLDPDSPWSSLHIDFEGSIDGKCFL